MTKLMVAFCSFAKTPNTTDITVNVSDHRVLATAKEFSHLSACDNFHWRASVKVRAENRAFILLLPLRTFANYHNLFNEMKSVYNLTCWQSVVTVPPVVWIHRPVSLALVPKGTDHCSSEEYRWTHVYARVASTWISYRCVPCHPWCTHRTTLVGKKAFPVFLWLWTIQSRKVLWFSCYKCL
jgi:hypothetical protein